MADFGATTDPERQYLYKDVLNFLGKPASSALPGVQSVATGGAPSIASAPTVGGVAGGATGSPSGPGTGVGGFGGGVSVSGKGGMDFLSKAPDALKKLTQGATTSDLGTRGDVGGPGTPQDNNTSLSDRLRSGTDIPNFAQDATSLYGKDFAASVGNVSPTDFFNSLTESGLTPAQANEVMSLMTEAPEASMLNAGVGAGESAATGLAGSSLAGLGAGAAGALVGALPGLIGQAAHVDPETGMILNAAGQVIGTVAAPAITGAIASTGALGAGAAGAGAGSAAAGAGAGIAAAGPALIAAAPIAALMIMQQVLASRDNQNAARKMKNRLRNIQGQLPGELQQLEGVPDIANSINPDSSKEDVVAALKKLNDIQTGFQEGGWESYLKSGGTTVGGGTAGQDITANIPGVQQALKDSASKWMTPYMAGELRGEDILGNMGMTPDQITAATGRYINPLEFALDTNSSGAFRSELLPTFLNAPPPTYDYSQEGGPQLTSTGADRQITDPNEVAALKSMGLPTTRSDGSPITQGDIFNAQNGGEWNGVFNPSAFDEASGPGMLSGMRGRAGEQNVGIGNMNPAIAKQFEAVMPGKFESSLIPMLADYGGISPALAAYLAGHPMTKKAPVPAAAPAPTAASADLSTAISDLLAPTSQGGTLTSDELMRKAILGG